MRSSVVTREIACAGRPRAAVSGQSRADEGCPTQHRQVLGWPSGIAHAGDDVNKETRRHAGCAPNVVERVALQSANKLNNEQRELKFIGGE